MSRQLLEIVDVSKTYRVSRSLRVTALASVTLGVHAGECVVVTGENGAGKTTLLTVAVGLVQPDRGRVLLGGRPAGSASARRGVGFAGEVDGAPGFLSGRAWLFFHGRVRGLTGAKLDSAVLRRAEELGIRSVLHRRVSTYSRGTRQRLALAAILLSSPRLLVLDEPQAGIDPDGREAVVRVLAALRQSGAGILLSTHHPDRVSGLGDRFVVLKQGSVVNADGKVSCVR